jgi:hypothetical protein
MILLIGFVVYDIFIRKSKNGWNYPILCLCLIFISYFCVPGFQEYRVRSPLIDLQGKMNRIETQNKELQKIVSTLAKMIYVIADGAGVGWMSRGIPDEHREKIEEYTKQLSSSLLSNFEKELANDLNEIHTKEESKIR